MRSLALIASLTWASPDAGRPLTPCPEAEPTGWLTVSSDPWAIAFVDEKRWGDTPIVERALTAGRHNLRLENSHYGVDDTREFVIVEGQTLRLNLKVESKF